MMDASSAFTQRVGQALLETVSDAIVATDQSGIICLWNPGAERIFGFSSSQAVGQSLDIIIPENLRARHWAGWEHTIKTGTSRYDAGMLLSVPAITAQNQRISVEFTILMLKDATGAIDGMVATMRDVSARFEEMRALRREIAGKK